LGRPRPCREACVRRPHSPPFVNTQFCSRSQRVRGPLGSWARSLFFPSFFELTERHLPQASCGGVMTIRIPYLHYSGCFTDKRILSSTYRSNFVQTRSPSHSLKMTATTRPPIRISHIKTAKLFPQKRHRRTAVRSSCTTQPLLVVPILSTPDSPTVLVTVRSVTPSP
jgi:hypothetical protein